MGTRDGDGHVLEPVDLAQPPRGPRAGRDDGPRGVQRAPLRRGQVGGPHLVTEREVHQHDQVEPGRLRLDDLRDAAGHEPVEEHGRAVGQRGQGPVQRGPRGGVGPGPPAVDGDLPRAQPAPDLPVVDVAAAGAGAVVDVTRDDQVGAHSSRS
jgi:hypothetical protein